MEGINHEIAAKILVNTPIKLIRPGILLEKLARKLKLLFLVAYLATKNTINTKASIKNIGTISFIFPSVK